MVVLQGSLFDCGAGGGRLQPPRPTRTWLDAGAWCDLQHSWVTDGGALFGRLLGSVPWRAERRLMYDRTVAVPRLVASYGEGDRLPDAALGEMGDALEEAYATVGTGRLASVGLCLYRDGADSVAWHGDTIGRNRPADTVVAIVSLGEARRFLLRPRSGGPHRRLVLGHGDLLVMGGRCQRTWEHAVPKTSRPTGPRISIQFRTAGPR